MRKLIAAAMLASFLLPQAGLADPLHKAGSRGDWRHADSGWIFPTRIADLERVGRPYTIDGNNDVGAEYAAGQAAELRTALVDVFLPDSAATGATLAGAKSVLTNIGTGENTPPPDPSEEPFGIPGKPDVKGVKLAVPAAQGHGTRLLYFFTAPGWVVSVRATLPAGDSDAGESMDTFVRAMRWDTLGVYDDDMHSGGS